jgi:opacity protein-like surface antigen
MKTKLLSTLFSILSAGSLLAGDLMPLVPAEAASYLPENDWGFEVILYGWGAGVEGTTGVLGTSSNVDVGFSDILDNLDMGAMGAIGFRKGRVGFLADFMYLELSTSFETPGPLFRRTDFNLKETMVDLKGSYRVAEWDRGWFDITGGARYMNIDLGIDLQPGLVAGRSVSGDNGWWDAIGGFRTQHHLTDRVFLTALADIGGGSSDLTWQAMAGVGYRFTNNVHSTLAYRILDYDYTDGGFTYDVATSGVALGLGITW